MRVLVIVDPQQDFIAGSLPVAGAAEAMDNLAKSIASLPIDEIVVTMDCHPIAHTSFNTNGGMWPPHCIKYSAGAAIWAPLMDALTTVGKPILFLEKGREIETDQYSAFEASYPELLDGATSIYICGLAGDVCVLNSLSDLVKHGLGDKITVITDASPSLDDGSALKQIIDETGVGTTTIDKI